MYAGAIAVPLIVGRALQLAPEDVAFLISADLFVCGVASILQSLGFTPWFGIKLPVMMGVTFAAVGPMVSMAVANPGPDGALRLAHWWWGRWRSSPTATRAACRCSALPARP